MNLIFGTLAIACLLPTTLAQGVLVLPQQAGQGKGIGSQPAPVAPATSTPLSSSTGIVVLAQNAPSRGSAANQPGSAASSVSTPVQTPAPAPSAPGVLVLANGVNNSPGSVATPISTSVQSSAPAPSSPAASVPAPIVSSASKLEPPSSTVMQSPPASPANFIVLAQQVASNSPDSSQSVNPVPPPSTLVQSVISATTPPAAQTGLPNDGIISIPPVSTTLAPSTLLQSVVSAVAPISAQSLPVDGIISQPGSLVGTFIPNVYSASSAAPSAAGPPIPAASSSVNNTPVSAPPAAGPPIPAASSSVNNTPASAQAEDAAVQAQTAPPLYSASPSIVLAQNAQASNVATPQEQACQNPGGVNGIDPSCWAILGMSNYTNTWWANNNAKCGGPTANFSTCWFELHGQGWRDCTSVTPGACPVPDSAGFSAQDYYISYNIYGINEFFSSLYVAIGNANTLAAETVGAIVALIDPPKKENLLTDNLLTAISATINIILPIGTLFQRHFIALTQQTPPVSKYLFPVGTTESQLIQWESIQQELANIVEAYQSNVSQIIPTINKDIDLFVTFAETGAFSVNPLPNLANESDKLLLGLNTFVISKAFQANNIVIGQATDTDINQLVANSSGNLAYDTGCPGKGYNSEGMCGPFYYDPVSKNTFSLDNLGEGGKNYTDQLHTVLSNWTTGDMLFGGAYRCQNDGGIQGTLAQTVISTNGNVTLDCLSDIKVCEWNFASLGSTSEFTDCPTQKGYVVDGCIGCGEGSFAINVPNGYLGKYLFDPGDMDCVCNS